jgi:hypothetical protein
MWQGADAEKALRVPTRQNITGERRESRREKYTDLNQILLGR